MDSDDSSKNAPIYLNVYDVTDINNCLYWLGLGIFHSAIEVHGVEYAFGAHDYPSSGVFEVQPRCCPGFIFRKSIVVGRTDKDPIQFQTFIDQMSLDYAGDSYHLIAKNCNHFTNDVLMKLIKRPAPGWVNRVARIAAFCSCLLPESLQINSVRHDPEDQSYEYANVQEDFFDEEQHLLRAPNGNLQSDMQDYFYDPTMIKRTASNI